MMVTMANLSPDNNNDHEQKYDGGRCERYKSVLWNDARFIWFLGLLAKMAQNHSKTTAEGT